MTIELVVTCDPASAWDHFLAKGTILRVKRVDDANVTTEETISRVGDQFRFNVDDRIVKVEMTIRCDLRHNGVNYQLLWVAQVFDVVREGARTTIVPTRWQKGPPDTTVNMVKGLPSLHPLLEMNGAVITVAFDFVDITSLFYAIHGGTPWFMALELLKRTPRTMKVLASLRGHPFVWHILIPESAGGAKELQPNLLIYPFDYGGINYVADSIDGITSANHSTSIGDIQCGGQTLFSFITTPLLDDQYEANLDAYLSMMSRFKKRVGRNPPPLHHYRDTISYEVIDGKLVPQHWNIPFGFEKGIYQTKQILLIPQINGGDGGLVIKAGLMKTVERALWVIYTNSHALHFETVSVAKPILTCYSQSGGNAFTACQRNLDEVRALVCFEPQYMNTHLKGEDKSLILGRDVIPLFLRAGGKVVVVARHREGWKDKYVPAKAAGEHLWLLPDDSHYFLLDYPDSAKPYVPDRSPVLARRYSRLLKSSADPVINSLLSKETGTIDFESAQEEARVQDIIATYRKAGFSDEKILKEVFVPVQNIDNPGGGYFIHNYIVSSGQERTSDDRSTITFFHQALGLIG